MKQSDENSYHVTIMKWKEESLARRVARMKAITNVHKNFVRNHVEKKEAKEYIRDSSKLDHREIWCDDVESIYLSENTVHCRVVANTVLIFRAP
jgi:hypothetical protein